MQGKDRKSSRVVVTSLAQNRSTTRQKFYVSEVKQPLVKLVTG